MVSSRIEAQLGPGSYYGGYGLTCVNDEHVAASTIEDENAPEHMANGRGYKPVKTSIPERSNHSRKNTRMPTRHNKMRP